jgi:hypothetical protein
MIKTLTLSNVADFFSKAVLHNRQRLKDVCFEFIGQNIEVLRETNDWQNITNFVEIVFDE